MVGASRLCSTILLHHEDHSVEGMQGINHPQGLGTGSSAKNLSHFWHLAADKALTERRGADTGTEVSLQGGDREEPK